MSDNRSSWCGDECIECKEWCIECYKDTMQPGGECPICGTDYGPLRRPSESNVSSRQLPGSLSDTGITPYTISTLVDGAPVDNLKMAMLLLFGETREPNRDDITAILRLLNEVLIRFPARTDPIHMDINMTICLVLGQLLHLEGHELDVQLLLVQLQLLLIQVFNILKGGKICSVVCGDAEGTSEDQEDPEFVTPPPWKYTGPNSFSEYMMELQRLCKQLHPPSQ